MDDLGVPCFSETPKWKLTYLYVYIVYTMLSGDFKVIASDQYDQ